MRLCMYGVSRKPGGKTSSPDAAQRAVSAPQLRGASFHLWGHLAVKQFTWLSVHTAVHVLPPRCASLCTHRVRRGTNVCFPRYISCYTTLGQGFPPRRPGVSVSWGRGTTFYPRVADLVCDPFWLSQKRWWSVAAFVLTLTFIHRHFPLGAPSGPAQGLSPCPGLWQDRKRDEPVRDTLPFPSPAPRPYTPPPFPTPFTFPPGLTVFPGPRYHDLGLERPSGMGLRVRLDLSVVKRIQMFGVHSSLWTGRSVRD